jgi:hypothetical protein
MRKFEAQEAACLVVFFEQCLTVRIWGGFPLLNSYSFQIFGLNSYYLL